MIGRLIERLFVQVRADMSQLSSDLKSGVRASARATDQMAGQWTKVETHLQGYKNEISTLSEVMSSEARQMNAAMSPIQRNMRNALNPKVMNGFVRSTGQARMQMLNLGYQINDVGMTLATGMNPLTVMIQQGSQILQIYAGQGGIRMALKDISRILGGIGKRLWPIAVMALGFKELQKEINTTSKVQVSFMDTIKATFQVMGTSLMKFIEGPLKAIGFTWNATMGGLADFFVGVMKDIMVVGVFTVKAIAAVWNTLPAMWHDTWTTIKNFALTVTEEIANFFIVTIPNATINGTNKMIQAMVFGYRAIELVWSALPGMMRDAIAGAVNWMVEGVENMIKSAIGGLKSLFGFLDKLPQAVKDAMGIDNFLNGDTPINLTSYRMNVEGATRNLMEDIGKTAADTFNENFVGGLQITEGLDLSGQMGAMRGGFDQLGAAIRGAITDAAGQNYVGEFFEAIKDQAVTNALARIAAGMEDIGTATANAMEEVDEMMKKLDEQLTAAADNLAGVFGSAFERIAETGRFVLGDFVQDLNKLIISSVSQTLQVALADMFKGMVLGSSGGLGGMFSQLFSGLFGGMGGRQGGGVAMPWESFVAGENGPEIVSQDGPSGARRVQTAGQTRAAMGRGASPVQVNMYISTPDVNSFEKSQGQLASRMGGFINRGRRNG